ncbi:MAG: hypothetical protein Fur004_19160 [Thermoflexibacter sp.]
MLFVWSIGAILAQESDDLYFFAKDRESEMVAKRASTAKLNAITMRDAMQDESMRSKFANPDYQANTNQNTTNLPYFRKDYRRDYSFNSLYANNAAMNNRFGFFNNPFMSSFGVGMMWGNPSMMWNDPWMMNRMAWNSPWMWNDPWMMNSMMWNDPWMMNRMAWNNPWMMNSWNRWNMGWGMGWNNWNSMYWGRNMFFSPYQNVVNSVSRSTLTSNSATRPTSGADYASYIRSSSAYGNYSNSSVGNSANYNAVEYKGGTANSYFYGTPNTANGSNWGTRSVDYNNRGSYNNSIRGSSGNSGYGSSSSGFGSYGGGGGSRSVGGRGGRGN